MAEHATEIAEIFRSIANKTEYGQVDPRLTSYLHDMLRATTPQLGNTQMRPGPFVNNSIVSFVALLLALFLSAPGCSNEDKKPRPDFMSKSASTQDSTTSGAEAAAPTLNAKTAGDTIDARPSTPTTPTTPTTPSSVDDPNRSPTIVIVEEPGNPFDEAAMDDDWDQFAANSDEENDGYDEDSYEEDYDEADEPPSEENGQLFYGSTRPFIPPPIDEVDPVSLAQNVDDTPPAPSPGELERATVPWKPVLQSELEKLLEREKVYPTEEELRRMRDYTLIPAGDNPNPTEHP
jgi:hypothetical protein